MKAVWDNNITGVSSGDFCRTIHGQVALRIPEEEIPSCSQLGSRGCWIIQIEGKSNDRGNGKLFHEYGSFTIDYSKRPAKRKGDRLVRIPKHLAQEIVISIEKHCTAHNVLGDLVINAHFRRIARRQARG